MSCSRQEPLTTSPLTSFAIRGGYCCAGARDMGVDALGAFGSWHGPAAIQRIADNSAQARSADFDLKEQ